MELLAYHFSILRYSLEIAAKNIASMRIMSIMHDDVKEKEVPLLLFHIKVQTIG